MPARDLPAILTRHLESGCNDFLNDDLSVGIKRLTGTRSNMSPFGANEDSPSNSPDPSTPMNNAGEPSVAFLMAGMGCELCVEKCLYMCVCMRVHVLGVSVDCICVCSEGWLIGASGDTGY